MTNSIQFKESVEAIPTYYVDRETTGAHQVQQRLRMIVELLESIINTLGDKVAPILQEVTTKNQNPSVFPEDNSGFTEDNISPYFKNMHHLLNLCESHVRNIEKITDRLDI